MVRKANAVWQGTGKEGKGVLSTQSGVLNLTQYSFNTRFEDGIGTNPEELIGAAHAGCFAMKLSFNLTAAGFVPTKLDVQAEVMKKFKSLSLSNDQLKTLVDRRKSNTFSEPCPLVTLTYNPIYDTAQKATLLLSFKAKYRKDLISKAGVNGRQADQLLDAEVWKQKEANVIAKIPSNDFNRIRKTVEMHNMMERKYKLVDMTDQQKAAALELLKQVQ